MHRAFIAGAVIGGALLWLYVAGVLCDRRRARVAAVCPGAAGDDAIWYSRSEQ